MRTTILVISLAFLGVMGVLTPAHAAPSGSASHVTGADRAYARQLTGVFRQMVAAAQVTQVGFTAFGKRQYNAAAAKFQQAMNIYRAQRSKVYSLSTPRDMAKVARYLKAALTDYLKAVTLYRDGTRTQSASTVLQGVTIYKRANTETQQATNALKAIK